MRYLKTVLRSVLPLLFLVSSAIAQGDDGFIGIYTDPEGTTSCGEIPQYSGDVLYIVAHLEGQTYSGIQGAEFRIEVTNPDGWVLTPVLYNDPTAIGAVLDLDPGSENDDAGVALSYSECQTSGMGSTVLLGEIQVFNSGGDETDLLVRAHTHPTNPTYPCPLLITCDVPTYSKICMTQSPDPPCSTLSPEKVIRDGHSAVFRFSLNHTQVDTAFSQDIPLGEARLWVGATRITSNVVTCSFDSSTLIIGSISVKVTPQPKTLSPQKLIQLYGDTPTFSSRLDHGDSPRQAAAILHAEMESLNDRVALALNRGLLEDAIALLEESSLVDRFKVDERGASICVYFKGIPWLPYDIEAGQPTPHTRANPDIARSYLEDIEAAAKRGGVVLVAGGSVLSWTPGSECQAAEAQLEHIATGGTPASSPAGPLNVELLKELQRGRSER